MLFYVMSPYSGTRFEMFERHWITSQYVAQLSKEGIPLISPVMHWHFSAHTHGLPTAADYWHELNMHLFNASDAGILLMQPGWQESKGVQEELQWHESHKKPIYTLDLEATNVDGYTEKSMEILLKNLREDYPLLKEVPVYADAP